MRSTPNFDNSIKQKWSNLELALAGTTATFVLSQTIWLIGGYTRDFSNAPSWITQIRLASMVILMAIMFSQTANIGKSKRLAVAITTCSAGLLITGLITDLLSGSRFSTANPYLTYLFLTVIVFQLPRIALDFRRSINASLRIIVWMSLFLALVRREVAFNAGTARIDGLGTTSRLSGAVGDANTLAFFALLLLVAALCFRLRFWQIDVLGAFSVLIFAQTRFSLVIGILVLVLGTLRFSNFNTRVITSAGTYLAAGGLLLTAFYSPVTSSSVDGSDFWNTRLVIWQWALSVIPTEPFIGLGLSGYYSAITLSNSYWVHAHNQILQDLLIGGPIRATLGMGYLVCLSLIAITNKRSLSGVLAASILVLYSVIEVPLFFDSLNFRFLGTMIITFVVYSEANGDSVLISKPNT